MPEPPRRPSPFLFLMLASPILKVCAACWLAFGIVGLWTAYHVASKAELVDKAYWFALGGNATWLVAQTIMLLAAGDLCIALIDMHRDLGLSRERLERGPVAPAAGSAPPPAPRP
ncbi:MAG: hypothetical protein AAB074_22310 [Planctomycetota bacterium]